MIASLSYLNPYPGIGECYLRRSAGIVARKQTDLPMTVVGIVDRSNLLSIEVELEQGVLSDNGQEIALLKVRVEDAGLPLNQGQSMVAGTVNVLLERVCAVNINAKQVVFIIFAIGSAKDKAAVVARFDRHFDFISEVREVGFLSKTGMKVALQGLPRIIHPIFEFTTRTIGIPALLPV